MNARPLVCLAGAVALVSMTACDTGDGDTDPAADAGTDDADADADADTDADAEAGTDADTGADTEPEPPLDSDEDGLSDAEEADLGTDPFDKDTDDDNYWDSWEVIEGTDPLDKASRIYTGYWPYNPAKDDLVQGTWAGASTDEGSQFPRQTFVDQHGEVVELYDFANFTSNDEGVPAYLIIDMSAQWCGPCHNMAEWISGVDNSDTLPLQQIYPSVREKVHSLRIWWVTIIVENASGGPPSQNDTQSWATTHPDPYIPVLADETQQVRDTYNGGQYPFFFLLEPTMAVEFWKIPDPGDNNHPALWMVQQYL